MSGDHLPSCRGIVRSTVRWDLDLRYTVPLEESCHQTVDALGDEDVIQTALTDDDRFEDRLIGAWQSVPDEVECGIDA